MKITVVIITYNRKDDLKVTLRGFLRQTYENKEIIVLDNASVDGTPEMMAKEFPDIRFVRMPYNLDILSINVGIQMTDGDIIWRTDDDSHPEDENTFSRIVEIFETQPDVDIIATEDIEVNSGNSVLTWYPHKVDKINVPPNGYKSHFFAGPGAAIRRKVFDKIGGFWEFGFEELDFCSRAIIAGFNVRYFPNIRTLHFSSKTAEIPVDRWIKNSSQYMRYNWKFFPFWMVFFRTIPIVLFQLLNGIISRFPFSALCEGLFAMLSTVFSTYRKERTPVPRNKVYDLTLGVSYLRNQSRYFKQHVIYRINRWRVK